MKNYKVRLRGAAKRDVKVLNRYLIRNFSDSKVNEVLTSLQESITRLGSMPNLGRDARELSSVLLGYRFLRLPKNTIFYKVHDEKQLVEILRVCDNRMDVLAVLLQYLNEEEK